MPENTRVVIHLGDEPVQKVGPRLFRKRVLRYSSWRHPNAPGGILAVDREYARRVVSNFMTKAWDHAAVTLGHPKGEAAGLAAAVGEVVGLEDADDGVWATLSVDQATADAIDEKKIKGCSAGLVPNYVDHEVGGRGDVGPILAHLALTNEPYIKGLGDFEPVHLADGGEAVLLSPAESDEPPEGTHMTLEELLAQAKKDGLDAKAVAKGLGIDVEGLEAKAALADKVPTLEEELEALKKAAPPADDKKEPTAEELAAAKKEGAGELVAALGQALAGAKVIELAEGQEPDLATVVKAIVDTAAAGAQARVDLSEQRFENAFAAAKKAGKVVPAQKDNLKKVFLSDEATFTALIEATPKSVDFAEHGEEGVDLEEPATGEKVDAEAEVERYAAMAESK